MSNELDLSLAMDLCRVFEGLRLAPYICPAGVPTIGYGHTGPDVTLSMRPISRDQAEAWLAADLAVAARSALRWCPGLVGDTPRLGAITDFVFNLGGGRLQTSTLRRRVNERDWSAAAYEIRRWVRAGGRVLPGLVARREAEARLLLGGRNG